MLHSTPKTQSELLHSQNNAGEPPNSNYSNTDLNQQNQPNKNTELIHKEPIENTPLWIIGNQEEGYFIALGKYRITDKYDTIKETQEALEKNKWYIIVTLISIIHAQITEQEQKRTETINEKYTREQEDI